MRLYLEKRDHIKAFSRFPVLAIALLLAIFMSFLVLWSVGVNPFEAYLIVGEEIFLTDYGWQDLLVKITPLLLTGAAVALAAQMKLWNIGAEGQFHMGTFAVTWGALNFGHLNTFSLIPFLLILSIIGGGLWGCIPGVLKSRFGVNEIILEIGGTLQVTTSPYPQDFQKVHDCPIILIQMFMQVSFSPCL